MIAAPQLAIPIPSNRVAADARVLPDFAQPVFADDTWDLSAAIKRENVPEHAKSVCFSDIADAAWRLMAKEYLYARLHHTVPQYRRKLAPVSLHDEFRRLRFFLAFLSSHRGGIRIPQVRADDLDAYLSYACAGQRGQEPTASHIESLISTIKALHAFSRYFTFEVLSITPWPWLSAAKVAGLKYSPENLTPRVPEEVMGPYLWWMLRYVEEFADEILDARDRQDLMRASAPRPLLATTRERVTQWLNEMRTGGRGIPAHPEGSPTYTAISRRTDERSAFVSRAEIARQAGVCESALRQQCMDLIAAGVSELGLEPIGTKTSSSPPPRLRRTALERVKEWVEQRRVAGLGLPRLSSSTSVFARMKERRDDASLLNRYAIAAEAGVSCPSLERPEVWACLKDALAELGFEGTRAASSGPPRLVQLRAGDGLHGRALLEEERMLFTAAYGISGYLSGMRDSELQAARVGCCSIRSGAPDRYYLVSRVYKRRAPAGVEADWVVLPVVAKAVAILERMAGQRGRGSPGQPLFIRPARVKPTTSGYLADDVNRYLNDFRAHANELSARDESAPSIPDVNGSPWRFQSRQLRRTLAWYIACRPFGIVAGALQYKHVKLTVFQGYAGHPASGFPDLIRADQEESRCDIMEGLYESAKRGALFGGPFSTELRSELERIRREVGDFPGVAPANRSQLRGMLRSLAGTLYAGILNYCFFVPERAVCLQLVPLAERFRPDLPRCVPGQCANSVSSESQLQLWDLTIADTTTLLREEGKRMPPEQRVEIETTLVQITRERAQLQVLHG